MALELQINGEARSIVVAGEPATLDLVIAELGLQAGRVAVEHNGEIVPRSTWPERKVVSGDKLEVVHFVGGGNR